MIDIVQLPPVLYGYLGMSFFVYFVNSLQHIQVQRLLLKQPLQNVYYDIFCLDTSHCVLLFIPHFCNGQEKATKSQCYISHDHPIQNNNNYDTNKFSPHERLIYFKSHPGIK